MKIRVLLRNGRRAHKHTAGWMNIVPAMQCHDTFVCCVPASAVHLLLAAHTDTHTTHIWTRSFPFVCVCVRKTNLQSIYACVLYANVCDAMRAATNAEQTNNSSRANVNGYRAKIVHGNSSVGHMTVSCAADLRSFVCVFAVNLSLRFLDAPVYVCVLVCVPV